MNRNNSFIPDISNEQSSASISLTFNFELSTFNRFSYLYGNGLIAKRTAKTVQNTYFYHQNPVGSVIMITNYQGDILKNYDYSAFGTIMGETGTLNNDIKFAGKEQDGSGLYAFPARYYSPGLGKFITSDPYLPSSHPYNYCVNNPLKYIDPSGDSVYWDPEKKEYVIDPGIHVIAYIEWDEDMDLPYDFFYGWGAENQNPPGENGGDGEPPIILYNLPPDVESPSSVDPLTYGKGNKILPPQPPPDVPVAWKTVGIGIGEFIGSGMLYGEVVIAALNPEFGVVEAGGAITAFNGATILFTIGIIDISQGFAGEQHPFLSNKYVREALGFSPRWQIPFRDLINETEKK